MINRQKAVKQIKQLEQLCYTWSTIGIDSVVSGFRIRAASEGLSNPFTERVQALNRYESYKLPSGVNPLTTTPASTPVGLSLLSTGRERVLLQKVSSSKDGVGRPGACFIHLLAGLPEPEEFSPLEAIKLWKSPFFKRSENDLVPDSTELECISLATLQSSGRDIQPSAATRERARTYFPYIMEAYLTKRLVPQRKSNQLALQKLYIAAADDDLAYFIFGLIHCLPPWLVRNITFSTYEHDLENAAVEIVGTCWLSGFDKEDENTKTLFPSWYYNSGQRLAINCYTGDRSPLMDNPLVERVPLVEGVSLAAEFAQDALAYLEHGPKAASEFNDFREYLTKRAQEYLINGQLDTAKFFNAYETFKKPPSVELIKSLFRKRDVALATQVFRKGTWQKAIIDLVMNEPDWWQREARASLIFFYEQRGRVPELAQALLSLAQSPHARSSAVTLVKEELASLVSAKVPEATTRPSIHRPTAFKNVVDLLYCAASPEENPDLWVTLLNELVKIQNFMLFFMNYWEIYAFLMKVWMPVLPPNAQNGNLIQPLLSLPWNRLRDFLSLGLWFDWVAFVVTQLIRIPFPIDTAEEIGKKYKKLINDLLEELAKQAQEGVIGNYWPTALDLFVYLTQSGYSEKLVLLFTLLESPMGKNEEYVEKLLNGSRLVGSERPRFLKRFGKEYLPSRKLSSQMLTIFDELAKSQGDERVEKWSVVKDWLSEPRLSGWFGSQPVGEKNLERVLTTANLDIGESAEFFGLYGPTYIPLYPQTTILRNLFMALARINHPQKMSILFIWLATNVSFDNLEWLLTIANLDVEESTEFFRLYGPTYISLYPQSIILLNLFMELARTSHPQKISILFIWLATNVSRDNLERLLTTANLTADENRHFLEMYGKHYLQLYPQSKGLLSCVEKYLDNLFSFAISIFDQQPIGSTPSPGEDFVLYLLKSSLFLSSLQQLRDWYIVERFISSPTLLKEEQIKVADSLSRLYKEQKVSKEVRGKLFVQLADIFAACIETDMQLASVCNTMTSVFLPQGLFDFVYGIAGNVHIGIQQGRYTKSRYLPYIQLAFSLKTLISIPSLSAEQEQQFVYRLLDVLLKDVDRKTFDWLSTKVKSWSAEIATQWQVHESRLKPMPPVAPVPVMNEVPTPVQPPTDEQAELPPVSLLKSPRLWLERKRALFSLQRALSSGSIGRVVTMATFYGTTLHITNGVPPESWNTIDAAQAFFSACEGAKNTSANSDQETSETAIVEAYRKILDLPHAGSPKLKFTAHEQQRYRAARQYLAELDRQREEARLLAAQQKARGTQYAQPQVPPLQEVRKTGFWSGIARRFKSGLNGEEL